MAAQWPLIIFTLCITLACGILGGVGVLALLGKDLSKKEQVAEIITSMVVLCIGGIAVFFHLQHWERIFNGFGHITSGITHELIGVVAFFILAIVCLLLLKKNEKLPKWAAILIIVVVLAFVFVSARSYYMPARPAWSNIGLYLFNYAQLLLLGSAGLWLLRSIFADENTGKLALWTAIGAAIDAVAVVIYFFIVKSTSLIEFGYYLDISNPCLGMTDTNLAIGGDMAITFWLGALVIGALVALALGLLKMKSSDKLPVLAGAALVCSVAGAVCFRYVMYIVGVSAFILY